MRIAAAVAVSFLLSLAAAPRAQSGLLDRVLHPFGAPKRAPKYSDPRLRGLLLEISSATEPVRLSEVRQMRVRAVLSNISGAATTLDFPTEQRIEIQLLNPVGEVLTKWSDNRVFAQQNGTLVVNPGENIVYEEGIATRELAPGKVYTVEVFFPRYPELRARQKFITAP
ncbi:MAG: BsuPI-related putative proteinase inhibitor [Verrucomicrobiota bacterium]|nr:BsuPI-related putative proteinase inhibitor [Verrucomicrobiota bacterium]